MSSRGKITLLLFFFTVCGSAALVSFHVHRARPETVVRPADLYAVVNTQLVELRADNFSRAYQHASTNLQQRFNVDQFADMVRSDYDRAIHAQRVEFGFVERRGRRAVIQVFFIDSEGHVTPCIYSLVSEGEGWKIDGARLFETWPVGARLGGIRT